LIGGGPPDDWPGQWHRGAVCPAEFFTGMRIDFSLAWHAELPAALRKPAVVGGLRSVSSLARPRLAAGTVASSTGSRPGICRIIDRA